jgi:hypothetical protein
VAGGVGVAGAINVGGKSEIAGISISLGSDNAQGTCVAIGTITTGDSQTASAFANMLIGRDAGSAITDGNRHVMIGDGAGLSIATANSCVFVGHNTGYRFTGGNNCAIGAEALYGVSGQSSGTENVAMGSVAGTAVTTGAGNTMIGTSAGRAIAASSDAVCIGRNAGRYAGTTATTMTSGANSIFIGSLAKAGANSQTNQIVIGYDAVGQGSNTTTLGNSSTTGTFIPGGNLTLSNGNLILGTSGNGISFAETSDPSIPATAAAGAIIHTATNVSDGDTVTVGSETYTFKTALTPANYEVLISAVNAAGSLTNLGNAINGTGGTPGTDYQVPAANASASAGTIANSALPITALTAGTAGNSIALAVTTASAAWTRSAATLTGGLAAQGTSTELLNDYETGTWTARLRGATTDPYALITVQARYTKIGRLVYVAGSFENVNTTGASGTVRITGLPYSHITSREMLNVLLFNYTPAASSYNAVALIGAAGSGLIDLYTSRSGAGWTSITDSGGTGRYLAFCGCYHTS